MNGHNNRIRWSFLKELIDRGKCTPIIGNHVNMALAFGDANVASLWGQDVGFPRHETASIAQVAQFLSVTSYDEYLAKNEYLRFLKAHLFNQAVADPTATGMPETFLDDLEEELSRLTVSTVAARLGLTNFNQQPEHPLMQLAALPLPIYLTTSYHTFLQGALTATGKDPVTDYYRWSDDLDDGRSSRLPDDYIPTPEQPLVYHLYGLDEHPGSLVLTEENYFELFGRISQDLLKTTGIPDAIRHALAASSLILLGYQMHEWDFRILFRGPIKAIFNQRRPLSLAIQFMPQSEPVADLDQMQDYLAQYFRGYKFDIFWGDVDSFVRELWTNWAG